LKSTAICCHSGIRKGVSPLGDLLFDSYQLADNFFKKERPEGVFYGKLYNQCQKEGKNSPEEFERRFGTVEDLSHLGPFPNKAVSKQGKIWDAALIDPPVYLSWFNKRIKEKASKKSIDFVQKNDFVTGLRIENDQYIIETNQETIIAENIILATGAYSSLMKSFLPEPFTLLEKAKVVSGSYIIFNSIDWGKESFVVTYKGHNYIYHHWDKKLLIGGTTDPNETGDTTPNLVKLQEMYDIAVEELNLPLPPFENAKTEVGLRQKGIKRMPFWGKIHSVGKGSVYGILSLYKNGYTYSFKGAKDLCTQIKG